MKLEEAPDSPVTFLPTTTRDSVNSESVDENGSGIRRGPR